MSPFFPQHTLEWRVREPTVVQRLTMSLAATAVAAGILVHAWLQVVLSTAQSRSWWPLALAYGGATLIFLGLATAHLGNHTVRQWVWRAPLFAIVETATEAAFAALLITFGAERLGTEYAHWHDWPSLVFDMLLARTIIVVSFAIVLGLVVQWVRFALLRREHRASTAIKIHEMHEEELRQEHGPG